MTSAVTVLISFPLLHFPILFCTFIMVVRCCVPNCKSVYGKQMNISFHKVPYVGKTTANGVAQSRYKRRELWLKKIGLEVLIDVTKKLYVCSKHFISGINFVFNNFIIADCT